MRGGKIFSHALFAHVAGPGHRRFSEVIWSGVATIIMIRKWLSVVLTQFGFDAIGLSSVKGPNKPNQIILVHNRFFTKL